MTGIDYGLGRFGDRRLQKGGPRCMRRWWSGPVAVLAGLAVPVRGRCSLGGSCTTIQ